MNLYVTKIPFFLTYKRSRRQKCNSPHPQTQGPTHTQKLLGSPELCSVQEEHCPLESIRKQSKRAGGVAAFSFAF